MFKGMLLVECRHSESVWQAARRAGYTSPTHRVGAMAYSKPRAGEELIARVRAGKRSAPLPIFAKSETPQPL